MLAKKRFCTYCGNDFGENENGINCITDEVPHLLCNSCHKDTETCANCGDRFFHNSGRIEKLKDGQWGCEDCTEFCAECDGLFMIKDLDKNNRCAKCRE